jgi:flagellar motor switch protein FliN
MIGKAMPDESSSEPQSSLAEELAAALSPSSRQDFPGVAANASGRDSDSLADNLEIIMRIPVTVQIVLGSTTMPVSGLVKLGRGAVIPLDRKVGDPVDVVVNGRVVARGEVVVVDDGASHFGISLTEVLGNPATEKQG